MFYDRCWILIELCWNLRLGPIKRIVFSLVIVSLHLLNWLAIGIARTSPCLFIWKGSYWIFSSWKTRPFLMLPLTKVASHFKCVAKEKQKTCGASVQPPSQELAVFIPSGWLFWWVSWRLCHFLFCTKNFKCEVLLQFITKSAILKYQSPLWIGMTFPWLAPAL